MLLSSTEVEDNLPFFSGRILVMNVDTHGQARATLPYGLLDFPGSAVENPLVRRRWPFKSFVAITLSFLICTSYDIRLSWPTGEISEMIEIEVRIGEYYHNASFRDYENGGFEASDQTICEILAPLRYAGKELIIYHNKPMSAKSPWRDTGGIYILKISEADLTNLTNIFDGAIRKIKRK